MSSGRPNSGGAAANLGIQLRCAIRGYTSLAYTAPPGKMMLRAVYRKVRDA